MLMPVAAFADTRLTARHYRVLAAITFHDRGGANGRGCTASQSTLARKAGLHRPAVNTAIRELIEWGHVAVIQDNGPGRTSEICVVYRDPTCTEYDTGWAPETCTDYGAGSEAEPVSPAVHVRRESGTASAANSVGSYILGEAPSAYADVCQPGKEGREGAVERVLAIPQDGGFIREAQRLLKDGVLAGDEAETVAIMDRLDEIAGDDWFNDPTARWAKAVWYEYDCPST